MRDYSLNITKLANRLLPHFVRKPVHKAFVRSLLAPLHTVNLRFLDFVAEKRVEANLTSQTMLMEHYLNRAFSSHFTKSSDRIQLAHSTQDGLAVFFDMESGVIDPVVYNKEEAFAGYEIQSLHFVAERAGSLPFDFRVIVPQHFQHDASLVGRVIELIERYKIGGFGYDIIYI